VVHNGVAASWCAFSKSQAPHPKPFFLYAGNVKPHKNLGVLLEGFSLISEQVPHDLVILGKQEGFITGDESIVHRAALSKGRVHLVGWVDDEEVYRQYFANAEALLLPSLYEGFGLTPLEAMACGCPVLVSNVGALPEIYGDAALYCDPRNPRDIAEKMLQIVQDGNLREELRRKGYMRAKQFTWEKCAHQTLEVIEKVLAAK
jgi:glycosyltransferase involved in cell wall biosynthesis